MADGGEEIRVQLTRIEGGINLLNERHETTKADIGEIRTRLHTHGNRIQVLEAENHVRRGERQGFVASGKLLYTMLSLLVVGIGGLLLRAFGA